MPSCSGRRRCRLHRSIPCIPRVATMTPTSTCLLPLCLLCLLVQVGRAQTGELVPVISKPVSRTVELPAEILPFLNVSLHARVPGYVDRVLVDRGSIVKQGALLVELSAPQM